MRGLILTGIALCATAFLSGCVQYKVESKEQRFVSGSLPLPEYAPLERYRLAINLESNRELVAGEEATLAFSIQNVDTVPVRIPEWFAYEPENIQLYCQHWLPGEEDPVEDAWILLELEKTEEQLKKPDFRVPLELAPGNQVVVNRNFRIVRAMRIQGGEERRFFVKAKLNLKSVQVESPVFAVSVHSAEDEAKRLEELEKQKTK